VHGADGLDEITLAGKTVVAEAHNGQVKTFEIGPNDFGYLVSSLDHLRGGDSEANAKLIREVLSGSRNDEAKALVIMTAAAALVLGDMADDLRDGARIAERTIDSGAALSKLEMLIRATNL
jgi:anthranilate phosphoribosyltransferase